MSEISISKPNFLSYLHSFRGFAIINIVAVHAFGFSVYTVTTNAKDPVSVGNELMFHNSTIYFALISGLIFSVILKKKGYAKFFSSKFKYVVLPYVFFTLLYTIFDNKVEEFFAYQTSFANYLNDLPRNFIYGKAIFVLWYIPVLLFLYLITPLLYYMLHIKKWGHWLMTIIVAIPLFVRREEVMELYSSDFISYHNMIYFTGAYAAGMFLADDLENRIAWLQKQMNILIVLALFSSGIILFAILNDIDKLGLFSILSTLYYVQKITFSLLVLLFFKQLRDNQPKWLHPIANDAFSIYFLHIFFISILLGYFGPFKFFKDIAEFSSIVGGLFLLITSIALCMFVTWLFRKLFGKYSRMIVGS